MYKTIKKILADKSGSGTNIDLCIGKLLRTGMLFSCGTMIFGGILCLFQHHGTNVDYSPVSSGERFGVADNLRTFSGIIDGVLRFDGAAIIQAGVVMLIATPVLRIVFSMFAFLWEQDFLYVVITLIVLLVILSNMFFP